MDALKSMLTPLTGGGGLQDTLKLVIVGGTIESARRASMSAWNGFVDSFFLTATFSSEDYPYDWIMHWLAKQPAWGRSREFEITTRSGNRGGLTQSTTGDLEDDEDEDNQLVHGRRKRKVAFLPSVDTTHTIYYRGHWLRIMRTKSNDYYGGSNLKISVVARNNDILKKLVLEAKREYEKDAEHRVHIFMADTSYPCWRWNGARAKRPMSSIVLQPGVKDMLLADCKDFLCSEEWYAERGIPFRRGYLLHGVPGSGKTSLIHSLAGELGLDIYVLSLSSKGMSDNTLSTLMGNVPSRCILLLEDLDAAFTKGVSRDAKSTGAPTAETKDESNKDEGSTLSLSGLLNALDGVAAAEGRLLMATTNHIERLDPALSRPGRMDVWVNFTNATKWQAEGIFKCFFPSRSSPTPDEASPSPDEAKPSTDNVASDASQKNPPGSKRKSSHQIPSLSEEEICDLSKKFADAIPEDELSVASLQGYLLKNKTRPRECVEEVGKWVIEERETREKLKKEKEKAEKEEKEKEEKEKAEKEKEEKKDDDKDSKEKAAAQKGQNKEAEAVKDETNATNSTESSESTSQSEVDTSTSSVPSDNESSPVSKTDNISGTDEESVIAEDDENGSAVDDADSKREKWVAVKGQSTSPTVSADSPALPADNSVSEDADNSVNVEPKSVDRA